MGKEKEEKPREPTKEDIANRIKDLRSWIGPKEVQVHAIQNNIAAQEFKLLQIEVNIKDGWFIRDMEKKILEARTDYERSVGEHELKILKLELDNNLVGELDKLNLGELKIKLDIEEKGLAGINKEIIKLQRNHKVI